MQKKIKKSEMCGWNVAALEQKTEKEMIHMCECVCEDFYKAMKWVWWLQSPLPPRMKKAVNEAQTHVSH